jgi:glutathione-regulated potassium-efflux system ancillary protein KefC
MEHGNALLLQAAVYFAAAVIAVMAAHRLGLGSVAGYLLAGIAIGPWGLKLIEQPEAIRAFAELGVVFLLFVIGLELEPHRLWSMRTRLIGLGLSQVARSPSASTCASRWSPAWRSRSPRPRSRCSRSTSAARSARRAAKPRSRSSCSRTSP